MLQFPIHLSVFTEIHQSLEYDENENLSFNDFESLGTQKKMESSLLISISESATDKYSKKGIPFYLIKVSDIFPSDFDESKSKKYNQKLRPEFFLNYKIPLNPDVFLLADKINESVINDNSEAIEASHYIKNEYLSEFLKCLEEKTCFPMESYSLREIFHTQGVNMRYLGKIAKYTIMPYIKQICIVDMIARKVKTIFRYYFADYICSPIRKNSKK